VIFSEILFLGLKRLRFNKFADVISVGINREVF